MEEERRARGRSRRSSRRRRGPELRPGCLILVIMFLAVLAVGAMFAARLVKARNGRIASRDSSAAVEREYLSGDERGESGVRIEEESGGSAGAQEGLKDGAQTGESRADAGILLSSMSVEEKAAQLFFVTPEALTGVDEVYAAGTRTKESIERYPVGGLVYFRQNLRTPDQVKDMLTRTRKYSRDRIGVDVFTGVDEEGGEVARISGREEFELASIPDMRAVGDAGDPEEAYRVGRRLGAYLSELGFNLDFAPVADVLTNPENTVVARRSFGTDAAVTSQFVIKQMQGLNEQGVAAVLKHFPGHGGTAGDTHEGYAYTERSLEQLMAEDLVPFREGIRAGAQFIMAAHIAAPNVTGDDRPASLSQPLLTGILREQMGFEGVIITDALNMKAITEKYSSAEAAVAAIQAGADMLLMPEDFGEAYEGILSAVRSGAISEERLNRSVLRILTVKMGLAG